MRTMSSLVLAALLSMEVTAQATVTAADYDRARGLAATYRSLPVDVIENPTWLDASRFWYRKSVTGGHVFVVVECDR